MSCLYTTADELADSRTPKLMGPSQNQQSRTESISQKTETVSRKSRRKNLPRRIVVDNHCDLCGEDFSNTSNYLVHVKKCCNNRAVGIGDSGVTKRSEDDSLTDSLTEDNQESTTSLNIKRNGGKVSCDHCYEKFWQSELKEHIQDVHSISDMYTCCHCPARFNSRRTYASHMRYEHKDKKAFKCSSCNNSYELYESLKRHNRIHNKELALTCDECGKSFAEKITLKRHKTIHTGIHLIILKPKLSHVLCMGH